MPRDSQGNYTLPAGNPVVPGTLIEAEWANPTMADLGQAITDSLPRNGSAPMTGPLTLEAAMPTVPRHAASKAYVDQFLAMSTGMPIASVFAFGGGAGLLNPLGYLLCNGQSVSRTAYADLFAAIGTIYGAGDGSTSFNVPDLRDWFIRGRSVSRAVGSQEAAGNAAHTHAINDPTHTHTVTNPAHTHTQAAHIHAIDVIGDHAHNTAFVNVGDSGGGGGLANLGGTLYPSSAAGAHTHSMQSATPAINSATQATSITASATGISLGSQGDEARPKNVAMDYYIKAVNDSQGGGSGTVTTITSGNTNTLTVDNTDPEFPVLNTVTDVPFGLVTLDASGMIPVSFIPGGGGGGGTVTSEIQLATEGQSVFVLANSYTIGNNSLTVYLNGVKQVVGDDYVETLPNSITFTAPFLYAGDKVQFLIGATVLSDASGISYVPAGTGAVTTTVQTKLREQVSVKDFGAVGDGVTDDTDALNDFFTAIAAADFGMANVDGTYAVSAQIFCGSVAGEMATQHIAGNMHLVALNAISTVLLIRNGVANQFNDLMWYGRISVQGTGTLTPSSRTCDNLIVIENTILHCSGVITIDFIDPRSLRKRDCQCAAGRPANVLCFVSLVKIKRDCG